MPGRKTPMCSESECRWEAQAASSTDHVSTGARFECERVCWAPKDGELCLNIYIYIHVYTHTRTHITRTHAHT